jgi:iron complex outermembrane receptor protein
MRLKTLILCSTSLGLVAGATPALAQDAPPTTSASPQSDTETQGDDAIVVTGLRKSLATAQATKRDSAQIVDVIVAEDIGKLPDIALSDTAARIPGVQVDRGGGEAGRVLVRGLPDFTTTYNGREIFTAETRQVALQDFPSGAIGAVEVYKSTTSNLIEGGLAGLINVRSRRPFDFSGFEVAGAFWELYPKESKHWTPNGNLLISDRWSTGIGEIGALVNFSYTRLRYLDSTRSNTDFVAGGPSFNGVNTRFPDVQRITYGEGDRERPSVNAALQWRPAPGLEFYLEGLYQGFRNKVSDRELTVPLWGGASYNNLVLRPGSTNELQSGTVVNPFRPDGFQGGTYNKTDTYQFAGGGSYEAGDLKLTADVAHTDSTFTGSTASVDFAFANPVTVNFNTDVPREDGGSEFSFVNVDLSNPATYKYRGFYEEAQQATGDDWQGRFDVEYTPQGSFISKIEAGIRYVDRNAHREFNSRYFGGDPVLNQNIPFSAVPLDYELFSPGFVGSSVEPVRTWLAPTYDSIRAHIAQLRTFAGSGFTDAPLAPDPVQTFDAQERSYAGYVQAHYMFGEESGFHVDGIVGVRGVKTELNVRGTTRLDTGAGISFVPIDVDTHYTDWLPNASARVHFTDKLQLRLSATKTRTRPGFGQYNPSLVINPPPGCGVSNSTTCIRDANGGNPNLRPLRSNNYDASLEYYFTRNGFASVAVFRRDLDGFIQNYQTFETDPSIGVIRVSRPYNTGRGRIDGAEAQVSTFFDFDFLPSWTRALGIQANVTYLDAKTGTPAALGGAITQARIQGVSKYTYNLVGMLETGGLSARLSYNHRSNFEVAQRPGYFETVRGIGRLDFSSSYNLTKNFTLSFDATNILGKPYVSDLTMNLGPNDNATFPRAVRFEETIYSFGFRFRF